MSPHADGRRALVIGASGQIGAALTRALASRGHQVTGTYAHVASPGTVPLDLADTAATARLIETVAPDWVFCPGGLTHVDGCERDADAAFRINRDGPTAAARAAAACGAGFVYYSTEYVFDGRGGPYGEDDPVSPISVYGVSKLEGERGVRAGNPRALVIRTTVVYGPDPQAKNFVYQLVRRLRAGERMKVPTDQVSSPTYNVDLAAASVELVERGAAGVLNVVGDTVLDRYAFAQRACDVFGLDATLLDPVTTAELGQVAKRPLQAGLRIDRARAMITTPLRGPVEGLRAMRDVLGADARVASTG
ncbi:MAG: SDR family oxidoreductase [Candidatus Rokubacteria bacterium]|nr:SDR family oxidoreductase [Candidatus Rokubacteria bacterium]